MGGEGTLVEDKGTGCISCRLIRGVGCLGIGSYLIYQGRQMKGFNQGSLFIFGGCFGVIGMTSLLGINIFHKIKLA